MNKRYKEANKYLVGGVNSPVRSFKSVGRDPLFIERGKGSKIYDYDGNKYIDYVLGFGVNILGHSNNRVTSEVAKTLDKGFCFGLTNNREIELAEVINKAISFVENIRFVNSGTEAVMGAIRLARAYTGKDGIVTFSNSYHGHADYLLARAGSGMATFNISSSAGVPKNYLKDTYILPLNDKERIDSFLQENYERIAAIIIEPVGGNYGVLLPDNDFLLFLRNVTKKYGIQLIFDEIITGFRFRYGSFSDSLGIEPDIICLGKVIGGGFPIGAYGGRRNIMQLLAPQGPVYQAATFGGHPVVMQAGISALSVLKERQEDYDNTFRLTVNLVNSILSIATKLGVDLSINYYGSMFSWSFSEERIFKLFYNLMLQQGVFFAPSMYEANFLSFEHNDKDIEFTVVAADKVLNELKEERSYV